MNKTIKNENINLPKLLVDTEELRYILSCGRESAVKIGEASGARFNSGRRVLWNVKKIQNYLDEMAA